MLLLVLPLSIAPFPLPTYAFTLMTTSFPPPPPLVGGSVQSRQSWPVFPVADNTVTDRPPHHSSAAPRSVGSVVLRRRQLWPGRWVESAAPQPRPTAKLPDRLDSPTDYRTRLGSTYAGTVRR